jgi:hypothetical protein
MFYNTLTETKQTNSSTNTNASISGTIEAVYTVSSSEAYIQSVLNGETRLFRFASNATINIDNIQKTASNLQAGMSFHAILNNNNEILSIAARTNIPSPTPFPTATIELPAANIPETLPASMLTEEEGYITNISIFPENVLTIITKRIRLTGERIVEEKLFTVSPACTIFKNGAAVPFYTIQVNDLVSYYYAGNVIYAIEVLEKERVIHGHLIEKKYNELTGTPVLIIESNDNKIYELRVTSNTYIQRRERSVSWFDLRVGDTIEAHCEYDALINVYAYGIRSAASGTLEAIYITTDRQSIVLRDFDNNLETYVITHDAYDIYRLRLGMELWLYLDSLEVYDIYILH